MKAFIAACLILTLLVVFVTANGILLRAQLDGVIACVQSLPDELPQNRPADGQKITSLLNAWEKTRRFAVLTVPAARTEEVTRALYSLRAAWDGGEETLYRQSRGELLLLLEQLRADEIFSVENIV